MAKGKVKAMHIKSMAGGHTLKVEREPDGDEAPMIDNRPEGSMHPDGSDGAAHIQGLLKAHAAMHKGGGKKSMAMPPEAMAKAFGR